MCVLYLLLFCIVSGDDPGNLLNTDPDIDINLFHDGYVTHVRSEIVAVRRRINMVLDDNDDR